MPLQLVISGAVKSTFGSYLGRLRRLEELVVSLKPKMPAVMFAGN